MWLFWSTLLLIVVCNEHVWSKVIRDAAKASSEPTAAPRIETAKKTVHLQANTLELRYAVTKDANSKVVSLRVSAECSQFLDKMYLAIAFSAQGAMVPSLALAGWMSRPNDHDDTPVAQCESFWMAQQSVQGISRVDRRNTAIDRCAMQRGYGTVALQFDIDIATNERLAAEAASNSSTGGIALPIQADGVRLTYAIGVANPALPMPLTFHNENYGTIFLSFDAVSVDKVPFVPTINIALAVHLFVMILFAMIALARLMKPMHSPEPTFMSHWVVRGLALIGASLSIYNAQISQHEHFADVHGALGLVLVLVTLLGPWLWHMLFSVHSSVPIVAVLVVMTQCVLGFIKMDSALLFAGVTIGLVVFLLLTEALFVNGFVAFASRKKTLHV